MPSEEEETAPIPEAQTEEETAPILDAQTEAPAAPDPDVTKPDAPQLTPQANGPEALAGGTAETVATTEEADQGEDLTEAANLAAEAQDSAEAPLKNYTAAKIVMTKPSVDAVPGEQEDFRVWHAKRWFGHRVHVVDFLFPPQRLRRPRTRPTSWPGRASRATGPTASPPPPARAASTR